MKALSLAGIAIGLFALNGAAQATDIRDYLPDGNLFDNPTPHLVINWNATTDVLEVQYKYMSGSTEMTLTLNTSSWVSSNTGNLDFLAYPPQSSGSTIYSINGTIDILPNGDHYLEYNVNWVDQSISAGATWSTEEQVTYMDAACDCSDGIQGGCNTNKCHSQALCQPHLEPICQWTD